MVLLSPSPVAPAPERPLRGAEPGLLVFSGSAQFRWRCAAAVVARRPLRLTGVRGWDAGAPGLGAAEASFLRLLCALTNGSDLRISDTGTALRLAPGPLRGGRLAHACGGARALGWFVEGVLPLLPWCAVRAELELTGVAGDGGPDWGLDALRGAALPLLAAFGLAASLDVPARGCAPGGGARALLACAPVRELTRSAWW